jgi:hypothetical protein
MIRSVAPVRTDVSVELSASIIRVTGIAELGKMLAETSNRRMLRRRQLLIRATSPIPITLMMEALSSSEMSALTRAIRRITPKDAILQLFSRFKFFQILT